MTDQALNQTLLGPSPGAGRWEECLCLLGAVLTVAWFAVVCAVFWVPAHAGVDQNGYMVGGKMFARYATDRLTPISPSTGKVDPYQFVGRMWVGADLGLPTERFYPKYPVGLPLLVAGALKLGGKHHGVPLAYAISPLCMTLGLLLCYWLIRMFTRPFLAFLGLVLLATSPMTVELATNPNSHASDFFFVVAGMLALCCWSRRGGLWLALLAGFLLGYSMTIRYTEGLLLLPLLVVAALATPWRDSRRRAEAGTLLLGWLIPAVALATYNLGSLGSLTGYDPTNESTGFAWEYFQDNWETMLRQLDIHGMPFFFSLGLAGLTLMFWWNWRAALLLASWIVPTLLAYTAYYWAPDNVNASIGYLRFFLSVLPGLVICAMALLAKMADTSDPAVVTAPSWRRRGVPAMAGLVVGLAALVNAQPSIVGLQNDYVSRLQIKAATDEVLAAVPPGSVIFCRNDALLHCLQFAGDYCLYSTEVFDRSAVDRLKDPDRDAPQGLQPQRRVALFDLLKNYDQRRLNGLEEKLMQGAIDSGRNVYMICNAWTPPNIKNMKQPWDARNPIIAPQQLPPAMFTTKVVVTWCDPLTSDLPPIKGAPRAHRAFIPLPRFDPHSSLWNIVSVQPRDLASLTQMADHD